MVENNDVFRVYNVKVKDQNGQLIERRTIDAFSMLQWLEMKEMTSSILTIDLDKIPEGKGVDYVQAKVCSSNLMELKLLIQDLLGMLDKPEDSNDDVGNDSASDFVSQPVSKPEPVKSKPSVRPNNPQGTVRNQQRPTPKDLFDDDNDGSDELMSSDDSDDQEIII
jgi:hypothetical protein